MLVNLIVHIRTRQFQGILTNSYSETVQRGSPTFHAIYLDSLRKLQRELRCGKRQNESVIVCDTFMATLARIEITLLFFPE